MTDVIFESQSEAGNRGSAGDNFVSIVLISAQLKIMRRAIILLFLAFNFLQGCENNTSVTYSLSGRWELDSSAGRDQEMSLHRGIVFQFHENGAFEYRWFAGDIGSSCSGKFLIQKNTHTTLSTLELITDTLYHGIKLHQRHFKFSITEFTNRRLKMIIEDGYDTLSPHFDSEKILVFRKK